MPACVSLSTTQAAGTELDVKILPGGVVSGDYYGRQAWRRQGELDMATLS
jgi:hypothetical protein